MADFCIRCIRIATDVPIDALDQRGRIIETLTGPSNDEPNFSVDQDSFRRAPKHRTQSWMNPLARVGRAGDGYEPDPAGVVDRFNRVAPFAPAILALRWGTTAVSLALAGESFANADWAIVALSAIIVSYTVLRSINPLRYTGDLRSLVLVIAEVALHVGLVSVSGRWDSPFVFSLLIAIAVAGFARGFGFALRVGAAAALAISVAEMAEPGYDATAIRLSLQWSAILLLVGVIAGYARRITGEADRQHSLALDRLERLSDANALLFSLHRVAQTLPASLDLDEALETTVARLRGLVEVETVVIMIFDDTDANWQVVRRDGAYLPGRLGPTELPVPLRQAMARNRLVYIDDLAAAGVPGIGSKSTSGVYTILPARGAVIGLLAIEHSAPDHFKPRDLEMLNGFIEPVALAIDNARWFGRLRTVGADEERTRIARDLHDRIGQSLAYLAFELDRIVSREGTGDDVFGALHNLRSDVRGVIGEVRDTLYDLRTDVSETQDLVATVDGFADRLRERAELEITIENKSTGRLPILQEREMWRIAQEALVNVERHARADRVAVRWRCDGASAALEIADNGQGFPIGKAGRLDSYGLIGMRERAASIGATLEIDSEPGQGTLVRCFVRS